MKSKIIEHLEEAVARKLRYLEHEITKANTLLELATEHLDASLFHLERATECSLCLDDECPETWPAGQHARKLIMEEIFDEELWAYEHQMYLHQRCTEQAAVLHKSANTLREELSSLNIVLDYMRP